MEMGGREGAVGVAKLGLLECSGQDCRPPPGMQVATVIQLPLFGLGGCRWRGCRFFPCVQLAVGVAVVGHLSVSFLAVGVVAGLTLDRLTKMLFPI